MSATQRMRAPTLAGVTDPRGVAVQIGALTFYFTHPYEQMMASQKTLGILMCL